jgi:hypothetical protein
VPRLGICVLQPTGERDQTVTTTRPRQGEVVRGVRASLGATTGELQQNEDDQTR